MTFVALSGLPRSGSTLLSSILSQNPEIHAEGNSAVCQLMWDMQVSCEEMAGEQLLANNRLSTQNSLISAIPAIYYKDIKATHIIDKCRSWTLPPNMDMLRRYITNKPKVIVLIRPIDEIIKSFVFLRKNNGWAGDLESDLLVEDSEPIMRSLKGIEYAKQSKSDEFIFIEYDDLVTQTDEVIKSIYEFCNFEPFNHYYNNIKNIHPENDIIYGLDGMHDIRSTISKRTYTVD